MEWTVDDSEAMVIKAIRSIKDHGHGSVTVKVQKHHIISVDKNEQHLI